MSLDEVGQELCALFAEERAAIAALDYARIEALVPKKHELAARLARVAEHAPQASEMIERIRIEAQATAMLAATAADAVRALLGYSANGYDRRARQTTSSSTRVVVAI
jgi:hypothetical protein